MITVRNTTRARNTVTTIWLPPPQKAGRLPKQIEHENEAKQRKDEREELHALLARRLAHHAGDEFVTRLDHCLRAAGHQAPARRRHQHAADDDEHRREHEQRRIGDRALVPADMAEDVDLRNIELVDRIHTSTLRPHFFFPVTPCWVTKPAARIAFKVPAPKPRRGNKISRHGDVPAKWSMTQPIRPPKRTPATNSLESLSAVARLVGSSCRFVSFSRNSSASCRRFAPASWMRSPSCLSLADQAASSF